MVVFLGKAGHTVNRKRVQRLMRLMGLAGMAPGPNTSRRHPAHKVYPYLLRGVAVLRPNQVWSADITYIRLPRGFAYLVAVIDWYSRKVLSWRISNTMKAVFCVDCLEAASVASGLNHSIVCAMVILYRIPVQIVLCLPATPLYRRSSTGGASGRASQLCAVCCLMMLWTKAARNSHRFGRENHELPDVKAVSLFVPGSSELAGVLGAGGRAGLFQPDQ
jgi:Transposase and inactivated derivatives